MGRVRTSIKVNGRDCWTLFDPGAINTYVVRGVAKNLQRFKIIRTRNVKLGGKTHKIREGCILIAKIKGKPVQIEAYVTDYLGRDRESKRNFEVLFGARAMQDWGLELDVKNEKLDLSDYPGEFVEF